ncbi:hypothetical protein BUALT_Bualt12G0121300 [Buddleja alternifolia]|uniref:Uncharacterized protein n=1 Tax=Buddleja alternifolia TaxID=168488 RepID=A0AAV6WQJ8_9LAMI|nr:hypothetical protein BUALT_Bualt12G0121300 [Buddleja alternifolia]
MTDSGVVSLFIQLYKKIMRTLVEKKFDGLLNGFFDYSYILILWYVWKTFGEENMPLEDQVSSLKAIGIAIGKQDLTGMAFEARAFKVQSSDPLLIE